MDAYFGMASVCRPGTHPNPKWRGKRGQRQCLKDRAKKLSLKDLQKIAKEHSVSIYKRRKDDMGFTRTPLTIKALKLRLSKMKVPYKFQQGGLPAPVLAAPFPEVAPMDFGRRFGMATVCKPGYHPNPNWKRGRGQKQCLKDMKVKMLKKVKKAASKVAKLTLKQLQALARANDVSIFKRRKDDMGFTRTPLTVKALKLRLTKMKVPYK